MSHESQLLFVQSKQPESLLWTADHTLEGITHLLTVNQRLYAENIQLRKKYEQLATAHQGMGKHQELFMDNAPVSVNSFTSAGKTRQKHASGGDFCNITTVVNPVDHVPYILTTVGDAADKGAPAAAVAQWVSGALSMAYSHSTELFFDASGNPTPDRLWFELNNMLYHRLEGANFVTITSSLLNTRTGELYFVRGGGEYLIAIDASGTILPVPTLSGSMAIGLYENQRLKVGHITIPAGGMAILHTDGPTDQLSPSEVAFTRDNLLYAAQESINLPAELALENLFRHVDQHRSSDGQTIDQFDDVTFAVIQADALHKLQVLHHPAQRQFSESIIQ